jgi:starch-binding outer membrane protein, SusD/RagB family
MKAIMKKLFIILSVILLFVGPGCQKDWLERESRTLITEDKVWNDQSLILGLLANYYNTLSFDESNDNNTNMARYDDAMWSGTGDGTNKSTTFAYSTWTLWSYTLIRNINKSLEELEKYSSLSPSIKKQYSAEFRFIRALHYFEHVKRMGGVPLVTTQLIYDFSGDVTPLQIPRAKEYEVYDFIASEMDAIKDDIGNVGSQTRANKYTCLALKCRAMLYAGSLAKYNSAMPVPSTTAGGEIGIPLSMAAGYYQKALSAADSIINRGPYSLYRKNNDLGQNFYEVTNVKGASNPEVIFAKDYDSSKGKSHNFTQNNIPFGLREESLSSSVTPVLNLVENFDYLDGSDGALKTRTANNSDYIYYNALDDIFKNKDARLYGTVIYPGTKFRDEDVVIQAGVKIWNATSNSYSTLETGDPGSLHTDGGLLKGSSGPHRTQANVTSTGFYIRKWLDPTKGASTSKTLSSTWWVIFRLGEVYMNATEAAYELGNVPLALQYINTLRVRAGFPANSLSSLSMDKIMKERRNELAFEDHRLWDLIRWRKAQVLWDGDKNNPKAMLYALYPYRVINSSDPSKNGKYVFDKIAAPRLQYARFFRLGNYYSEISSTVLSNNPLLIPNPYHTY